MSSTFEPTGRYRYRYLVLLSVLVAVGVWLRIRNLGHLSLIGDEGVQALAVEAILENGGRMESGLVYLRGPLYLYTQAALASLFQLNEFWLRIPSVVFGAAAIIPTYVLGKDLFNRPVGILSATIIALSSWEIEMSRYARVYIAFQFFFLLSLIFFYRGFIADKWRYRIGFLVVAFLTFLTHELSQVLMTLFLIPLLIPSFGKWKLLRVGYWAVGVGGLLFVARQINGIYLPPGASWASEGGASSEGMLSTITSVLGIPPVNGPDLGHFFYALQHEFIAVVGILLVVGITAGYLVYRFSREGMWGQVTLGLLMLCAAAFYQFGVVLIGLAVYLLLYARNSAILIDRTLLASVAASSICFVAWVLILMGSPNLLLVEVPLVTFGFPAFYKYLLRWLVKGWPVMTALLTAGSIWLLVRYLRNPNDRESLFLLGALYIPAVSASLFESFYDVEYTLHHYAVVVIIAAGGIWGASVLIWEYVDVWNLLPKAGLFGLAGLGVLLIGQDTNPVSSWNVSERTYQSEKPPVRNVVAVDYYYDYHPDIKGVSEYVDRRVRRRDILAVIEPDHEIQIASFYIGSIDYSIIGSQNVSNKMIIKDSGGVHYTTGSDIITTASYLEDVVLNRDRRVWIIGSKRTLYKCNPWMQNSKLKRLLVKITKNPDYIGDDGITFVKKIK